MHTFTLGCQVGVSGHPMANYHVGGIWTWHLGMPIFMGRTEGANLCLPAHPPATSMMRVRYRKARAIHDTVRPTRSTRKSAPISPLCKCSFVSSGLLEE